MSFFCWLDPEFSVYYHRMQIEHRGVLQYSYITQLKCTCCGLISIFQINFDSYAYLPNKNILSVCFPWCKCLLHLFSLGLQSLFIVLVHYLTQLALLICLTCPNVQHNTSDIIIATQKISISYA